MTVSINTNVNAMGAIRRLAEASSTRSQAFERLSSGLRINNASDDAAGLSVASTLNAKTRVYTQALRNVNDGVSYLNVADGGMRELKSVLLRLRELSTQSSNGSFSNTQRQALDVEAQALQSEYNRIIDTTRFNGISVFENETLFIQAGVGLEGSLSATLGTFVDRVHGDGTFVAQRSFSLGTSLRTVAASDINGDGVLDLVVVDSASSLSVLLSNGDGTHAARRSFNVGMSPQSVSVADVNGDGVLDLVSADLGSSTLSVLLGNGDGTFSARRSFISGTNPYSVTVADFNGDGRFDLVSSDGSILLGNGDGTFAARRSFISSGSGSQFISAADFNSDGKLDLVSTDWSGSAVGILLGNGDGTFTAWRSFSSGANPQSVSVADVNGDGVLDLVSADMGSNTLSVLLGNGDGTFAARRSLASGGNPYSVAVADFNDDGVLDLVSTSYHTNTVGVLLGNGDGTFAARKPFTTGTNPRSVSVGDFNGDGVLDLVSGDAGGGTLSILLGAGVLTTTFQGLSRLSGVSVATQSQALEAQGRIDSYLDNVNAITGVVGSALSRFQVAASLLSASADVTKAAESRIRDVDVAEESSRLISTGILQEAASAVLAHALKGPELALTLLKT